MRLASQTIQRSYLGSVGGVAKILTFSKLIYFLFFYLQKSLRSVFHGIPIGASLIPGQPQQQDSMPLSSFRASLVRAPIGSSTITTTLSPLYRYVRSASARSRTRCSHRPLLDIKTTSGNIVSDLTF